MILGGAAVNLRFQRATAVDMKRLDTFPIRRIETLQSLQKQVNALVRMPAAKKCHSI